MAIRILIADDHALVRHGIKRVLDFEDDIDIVGETGDGQEAMVRTLMLRPDILLLDLSMPNLSGLDVTRQLQAAKCNTMIIALTIHDNDDYIIEILKNGASGYILKDTEPDILIHAIRTVNDGGVYICPELEKRIFGKLQKDENITEKAKEIWHSIRSEQLSKRETEVLACIANGLSNKEIARVLFISERTIKNHLANIFRKINVKNRTQALVYVLKHKLINLN